MAVLSLSLGACNSSPSSAPEDTSQRTITIMGVAVGEQQEKFEQSLIPFEEATGIDVIYEGSDAFATLLPVRVESGNSPDLAMFPQPGLMADLAREGKLTPITDFVDDATLQAAYAPSWLDLGSVDGELYGVWYQAAVKSLVWYQPTAFESAGYAIPTTWDELMALTETIANDGTTPWCIGMESGDATGWVGTDWIEDIMLRTNSPDVYDQWLSNELPFTDSAVKRAFEIFGEIVLNPNYVRGGDIGVISTPFGDSPAPLFDDPPGCYLHRQATFIEAFLPETVDSSTDVNVFPLPPIDEAYGLPVLVSGDVVAMLKDTPESRELMAYLVSAEPHTIRAGLGSYLSPQRQVDISQYPDTLTQLQAEILLNAEVVRFDGSDMMPGAVGTGAFWSGMVDYVGGTNVDEVLSSIQDSWPQN